ncbi:MAG: PD-(D/E)XK nuclease family protein [bacterium]
MTAKWSVSKLQSALSGCGENWKRQYVLGERPPTANRAMVVGSSVHKAMEKDITGRVAGADPLTKEQAVDATLTAFEVEADSKDITDLADDPGLEEARERATHFAEAYATEISPTIHKPIASELHAEAEILLDGESIHIHGYIDVIDTDPATGEVRIRDLKTGKAFNKSVYANSLQLSMYSLLGECNGYGNAVVRIDHLRRLKTKGTIYSVFEDKRDARHHAHLGNLLTAAIHNERSGVFLPNPSPYYCNGCSFREDCIYVFPK